MTGADIPALAERAWESLELKVEDLGPNDRMRFCEWRVSGFRERELVGEKAVEPLA